jgi:site-specific recombinase XerD
MTPEIAALPLGPLIDEYQATFASSWKPVTRHKYRDDFARFVNWLVSKDISATTASLDFSTLLAYVDDLRNRPSIHGVWRGAPDAAARSMAAGTPRTLSANSVNCYVRPIRSFVIWLVDEGLLSNNPFRRMRRRTPSNPLLPMEETPTKSATLEDLEALERGCQGNRPIDLRDRAIVSVLTTTAARSSSVRLLRIEDIEFGRSIIRFRRAKGGKTFEVALHPNTRALLVDYLERGRPGLATGRVTDRDPGLLFPSARRGELLPLGANAVSLMLTRRYRAGGGTLRSFGSHRIRHGVATALVNNGMPLEEVSRYLGHSSTIVTRRYARSTPEELGRRASEALARARISHENNASQAQNVERLTLSSGVDLPPQQPTSERSPSAG